MTLAKKKIKLARLSICPCGFPTLHHHVQPGEEYVALPMSTTSVYTCGGCGHIQEIECIYLEGRDGGEGGFLPMDLFDMEDLLNENARGDNPRD